MKKHARGNTLSEYGIIGGLVLLVTIGTWSMLGGGLNGILACFFTELSGGGVSCSFGGGGGGASGGGAAGGSGSGGAAGGGAAGATGGGGDSIDAVVEKLPPVETVVAAATAGGLGADDVAQQAQTLQTIATEMEERNADPTATELIKELANTGHNLADGQETLEAKCPPGQTCGSMTMVEDYSAIAMAGYAAAYTYSYIPEPMGPVITHDEGYTETAQIFGEISRRHAAFLKKYEELVAYYNANPDKLTPRIKNYIDRQTAIINRVAEKYKPKYESNYDSTASGNYIVSSTATVTYGDPSDTAGDSSTTTQSSNNICSQQPNTPACTQSGG